ncbi:MAG: hypothetical protein HC777_03820 [Hyphomonadaceae bacterium]|nr:hypothetical protein [Hyphomonadaceae bacterium]
MITAGGDGLIRSTDPSGQSDTLLKPDNSWLDVLLYHEATDQIAVISGKHVLLFPSTKPDQYVRYRSLRTPNSIAMCAAGDFLAIGHSAGVSLFRTNEPEEPWQEFPCGGGPVSVALSPAGGFLFAGLSEPALAGWRLADGQGFRMGGYPGKPKQLVWHDQGRVLLTSGGPALLAWPMVGPNGNMSAGPMGQAAGVYRPRLGLVTAVACHGQRAAVGWSDGGVDVIDLETGQSRHLAGPKPRDTLDQDPRALTAGIISLSFRADGRQLAWLGETGKYGTAGI